MTGLPIYDRVMDEVEDLFHPRHYHDPSNPTSTEEPMSLATIEQDVRTRVEDVVAKGEELIARGKEVLETHLPQLADAAAKAEGSPIVQALEGAFLPPEDETMIATLIGKLASYAAEHAAQVPPPAAVSAPVADPAMGEQLPPLPQAGPVVAGQA